MQHLGVFNAFLGSTQLADVCIFFRDWGVRAA
jgi:hypothetical protein